MRTGGSDQFAVLCRAGLVDPLSGAAFIAGTARFGPNLAALYAAAALRHPWRAAVVDDAGSISYSELDRCTTALAQGMQRAGIDQRGRVGLLARNHRGFLEVLIAATKTGSSVVLLNTLSSETQLAEVVDRERMTIVFADAASAETARAAAPRVVTITPAPGELTTTSLAASAQFWRPLVPRAVAPPVLLTSGTTGVPRGARRTLRPAQLIGATGILQRIPYRAGDTVVIAPPLFHTWGFTHSLLTALLGGTAVLTEAFDPVATMALVERHRADVLVVVPTMLQRILVSGVTPEHVPRIVVSSGAVLPAALAARWMDRFGAHLYSVYGSTEVGDAAIADPDDLRAAPGTAGWAAPGTRLAVLDPDGQPVPTGAEGRIYVQSSFAYDGYTAGDDKRVVDGMIDSGDLGYLDEDERLFVTGRADDVIITGGEKVHPADVEGVLLTDPAVADVAVAGLLDDDLGQRIGAIIVLRDGSHRTAEELAGLVRRRLARYAVPRTVVFADEVPRNMAGKVIRSGVRAMLASAGPSGNSSQ